MSLHYLRTYRHIGEVITMYLSYLEDMALVMGIALLPLPGKKAVKTCCDLCKARELSKQLFEKNCFLKSLINSTKN